MRFNTVQQRQQKDTEKRCDRMSKTLLEWWALHQRMLLSVLGVILKKFSDLKGYQEDRAGLGAILNNPPVPTHPILDSLQPLYVGLRHCKRHMSIWIKKSPRNSGRGACFFQRQGQSRKVYLLLSKRLLWAACVLSASASSSEPYRRPGRQVIQAL